MTSVRPHTREHRMTHQSLFRQTIEHKGGRTWIVPTAYILPYPSAIDATDASIIGGDVHHKISNSRREPRLRTYIILRAGVT